MCIKHFAKVRLTFDNEKKNCDRYNIDTNNTYYRTYYTLVNDVFIFSLVVITEN